MDYANTGDVKKYLGKRLKAEQQSVLERTRLKDEEMRAQWEAEAAYEEARFQVGGVIGGVLSNSVSFVIETSLKREQYRNMIPSIPYSISSVAA